jgi:hypothetical protein
VVYIEFRAAYIVRPYLKKKKKKVLVSKVHRNVLRERFGGW